MHSLTIEHIPLAAHWLSRTHHHFSFPSFLSLDLLYHLLFSGSVITMHCTYQVDYAVFMSFWALSLGVKWCPVVNAGHPCFQDQLTSQCACVVRTFLSIPQLLDTQVGFFLLATVNSASVRWLHHMPAIVWISGEIHQVFGNVWLFCISIIGVQGFPFFTVSSALANTLAFWK